VLVFGAGFAIAWFTSAHSIRSIVPSRTTSIGVASKRAASIPTLRSARDGLAELVSSMKEPLSSKPSAVLTTAIRKSSLPEWMRFRYEHSRVAISIEMAIREVLNSPISMSEISSACSAHERDAATPDPAISMEIVLQGRDVTVQLLGCEAEHSNAAEKFCYCLLEHVAPAFHVAVPSEVNERDLAPYDGAMSLPLWRL
jgi:hypothetical protein